MLNITENDRIWFLALILNPSIILFLNQETLHAFINVSLIINYLLGTFAHGKIPNFFIRQVYIAFLRHYVTYQTSHLVKVFSGNNQGF